MSIVSENATGITELTSQYSAQVTGDLERNLKEQERLDAEIEALQAQLASLQHDHSILLNIQQALGIPAEPAAPEAVATVPAPRKRAARASGEGKQTKAKESTGPARKRTAEKSAAKASAARSAPTLVDLVGRHLTSQSEPRSAAEITTALAQQHPERGIKATVVRTTLEGLVAKNQAQRTKQGRSVFYTTPDAEPAAQDDQSSDQSA
ncbi:hypothetical protein [Streptomyces sp. NBC_01530]|uniref:hypothetical protein n=1 Tax=Streptomyces sp. NBC_01530 TaxID=2903895 RepID=UPI003863D2FB